jgi:hypothetical protein
MPEALVQASAIAAMHRAGLLTVTRKLRVDMPHPAVKAELARVRSATMDTARRPGASLHAAAPVLAHPRTAAVAHVAVAVVAHVAAVEATGND